MIINPGHALARGMHICMYYAIASGIMYALCTYRANVMYWPCICMHCKACACVCGLMVRVCYVTKGGKCDF